MRYFDYLFFCKNKFVIKYIKHERKTKTWTNSFSMKDIFVKVSFIVEPDDCITFKFRLFDGVKLQVANP